MNAFTSALNFYITILRTTYVNAFVFTYGYINSYVNRAFCDLYFPVKYIRFESEF